MTLHDSMCGLRRAIAAVSIAMLVSIAGATCGAQAASTTLLRAPAGGLINPTNVRPAGAVLLGDLPNSQVTVRWRHGPAAQQSPSRSKTLTPPPSHFIICFFRQGSTTHDCRAGTGVLGIADVPADALTRLPSGDAVRTMRESIMSTSKPPPRYEYEHTVTLPNAPLDAAIEWSVGACNQPGVTSCAFSAPTAFALVARDLAVEDIDKRAITGGISLYVRVRNDGRMEGESYRLATEVWEVRLAPRSTRALLDLQDAAVQVTDTVITRAGEEIPVPAFRSSGRPATDIKGFHPANSGRFTFQHVARDQQEIPSPLPSDRPLQAATCDSSSGNPACNDRYAVAAVCDAAPCNVMATHPMAVYAVFSTVNPGGQPADFDPADNSNFKTHIYVP